MTQTMTSANSLGLPTAPAAPPRGSSPRLYESYLSAYHQYLTVCSSFSGSSDSGPYATSTFKCSHCQTRLPSRNQLFRHLDGCASKAEPVRSQVNPVATLAAKSAKNKVSRQKKRDMKRIAKLESEIAMAKLNNTSMTTINEDVHRQRVTKADGSSYTRTQKFSRKLNSCPKNERILDHPEIRYQRAPPCPDLEEFENLTLPGYDVVDYVQLPDPSSFLAVRRPSDAQFRTAESGRPVPVHATPCTAKFGLLPNQFPQPEHEPSDEYVEGFDRYGNEKYFPSPPRGLYAEDGDDSLFPPGFSSVSFEPGHGRRESTFTRTGDDELFDSE